MSSIIRPQRIWRPGRLGLDVEEARHTLAKTIGARSAEIIVTAGATESINLALGGVDGRIVTTAIEHSAVLETARARGGHILPVDVGGADQPGRAKAGPY